MIRRCFSSIVYVLAVLSMISGPGMKMIPAVQAQSAISPDLDISSCFAPLHACEGGVLGDFDLTQVQCLQECRARADCLCISWGVDQNKKCRLETGNVHTNRGNQNYSAMMADASCTPIDSALTGGDPHFKTFKNILFSFHGGCDLLLMRSKIFDAGRGLLIHVRTTRAESEQGVGYSFISSAAVQIGNSVLETSADGSIFIDGSPQVFPSAPKDTIYNNSPSISFAGKDLSKTTKGSNGHIISFDLDLDNGKLINIRCNTKTSMIFVDVKGYFEDSEGLLGGPAGDGKGLLSRDKSLDLFSHWNSHGEEWQILDTEPMLFREKRFPQYPVGCVYDSSAFKQPRNKLRRRLLDSEERVSLDDARKVCAKSVGQMNQFCIDDVITSQNLELAEDSFYAEV